VQLQGRETATQITQVKHFWVDSKTNYEPETTKNNAQNIKIPNANQGQVIEQHPVKIKTETVSLELPEQAVKGRVYLGDVQR
jgi:hypothetical protein